MFDSPIFGTTRHGSDEERAQIAQVVDETPVTVFQELNKKLNERGLCISIICRGRDAMTQSAQVQRRFCRVETEAKTPVGAVCWACLVELSAWILLVENT
jgi:hypothetical protein